MTLARYCAYQERCVQEVQTKMADLGLMPSDFPDYLQWLAKNNYLHEGRFAEIYVRSKFNQKHWGRQKINFELRKRGISESLVLSAWESINDSAYTEQLNQLIRKKKASLKSGTPVQMYQKCVLYAQSKGYEINLIHQHVKEIFAEDRAKAD